MGVDEHQPPGVGLVHAVRIASRRSIRRHRCGLAGSGVMTDTFPRQQARTRHFSLGTPRSFQISPDGRRVVFLRSRGGSDPVTCLWALDLPADPQAPADQPERLVVDPIALGAGHDEPEEERTRRERSREQAGGVVAFATNADCTMAAFAIAGEIYLAQLSAVADVPRPAGAPTPAIDPRPDPTGRRVAYVCNRTLRIIDTETGADSELIGPDEADQVSYGLAEFVAAEEMGRQRGYWWAPDAASLLVTRVDNANVNRWYIGDPANPDLRPVEVRYPAAGTANADVELAIF